MTEPSATKETKPRPAPVPDPESAPFWAATLEDRLRIQRCTDCGTHQFYPRAHCTTCRGPVEWVDASGRATVHSYTVVRQSMSRAFKSLVPYVVALVDLEEGPRMMTNIVGCDPEQVRIDMPVRVRFEPVSDDAALPMFEPA